MMVLGVVWADHEPYLRVRSSIEAPSELVPVQGQSLSYRLDDDPKRTCVGHVPFRTGRGDYHDCHRPPELGSRVCRKCAIVEATFASNLHHAHTKGSAELDPAINKHLNQPNRLYLAAFRDGSMKIGTSTLGRSEKRLEEQGAWMARFVAETTNGRAVRHIEDAVTEQLGVPQAVSAVRKRRGLANPLADDRLAGSLSDMADEVLGSVVDSFGDQVTSMNQEWRHPMATHAALERVIDYPLRLNRGRHSLECVTAVGRQILVRRPGGGDVFVIDPAVIFGLWLDLGDYGSDEIAIQDSLF